jgi:hypothetical protein
LDAALAVMAMALIGQDLIGGEWLFGGYEAKIAAYVLVLVALRLVLVSQRATAATVLFALATWFHFLVGGFWFLAAMALFLLDTPRDLRRVVAAMALFALLIAPLLGVIGWTRFADTSAARAAGVPSPDVIYSIIREPHHQSPFLSWDYFHERWLPGYIMAAPMLLVCLWIASRSERRRLRVAALWLAGLLAYLFLILGPKFLDRDSGTLGKFYLFRPSSLILLLWLMLALAALAARLGRRRWILRAALLAVIGPVFLWSRGGELARDVAAHAALEHDKRPLVEAMAQVVAPGEVVLIDASLEARWLDFERRSGLPMLVTWKFAPTNDAELILWYRRMEQRRIVFEQGCNAGMEAGYLLTTPAQALRLSATCGPEVLRVGPWVLLRAASHEHPDTAQ